MITDASQDDSVEQALKTCKMVQFMIDFTAKQLLGLRTECKKTEEITQKEIRETESKLIKLFSNQLVAKAKLNCDNIPQPLNEYPNTQQWLQVAGVSSASINALKERNIGLNKLLRMKEDEINKVLSHHGASEEESRTLNAALKNLRSCTGNSITNQDWHFTDLSLTRNNKSASNSPCNGNSPKYQPRPSTSSLPADNVTAIITDIPTPPVSTPSSPLPVSSHSYNYKSTPPATPPPSRLKSSGKYPSTPPPKKKMQLFPEMAPITKSKSHESQLANRVIDIDPVSHEALYRRRLSTDGSDRSDTGSYRGMSGHNSPGMSSPLRSPPCFKHEATNEITKYSNTLTVPKSPKTPMGTKMKHHINHRFTNTFKITTCDVCHKQMFIGFKCKDCKKKFHKDCASRALPSCGMTDNYIDSLLTWSGKHTNIKVHALYHHNVKTKPTNPNINLQDSYLQDGHLLKQVSSLPGFPTSHLPDSSSTSSCNSSTPSSPALHATSSGTITSPSPSQSPHSQSNTFRFPGKLLQLYQKKEQLVEFTLEISTYDLLNTFSSNTSDKVLLDRVDSIDSQDDPGGHNWKRGNSVITMKEWDIPYEQLVLTEQIGTGRFGTVFKGHWHGPVAIKVLAMDDSDNQAQLAAFKLEVGVLRKTRHENLVLFMGACMKEPRLAIVTSFCKGETLFSLIHIKRDSFKLNKALIVASQIAQGMGYLHARGIIHKDLRTKNVFVDAGKVVITDFGLFNVTKICRGNNIPPGWLCYLSPEIIRTLHARQSVNMEIPFTEMSDIYAFGTMWYELLVSDWPFKSHPAETIIWQVGRGMKQSLSYIGAPREVKDILMSCWAFKKEERPEFSQISKALERIPKTRLIRSPSHPVHLSRSTEGIFNT
ncbi:hypothetical protein LOTGIDRAFT_104167 [Lottia gigantea]|uniref:non-specific serine/threonine protein kinase n=1 Tax=Lottia gigantea TaxID=225164 RepID=V4AL81_LOTGI|nr:hypothetical protein LOTGIDRAFT_104167 [Lottia gigantea]ESO97857.1 hypothetical protein LOTGIDRAFT_104167 [Lottia gigantea]